jgi:hypothetical protein
MVTRQAWAYFDLITDKKISTVVLLTTSIGVQMSLNFLVMHFLELGPERARSDYPSDYQSHLLAELHSGQTFLL